MCGVRGVCVCVCGVLLCVNAPFCLVLALGVGVHKVIVEVVQREVHRDHSQHLGPAGEAQTSAVRSQPHRKANSSNDVSDKVAVTDAGEIQSLFTQSFACCISSCMIHIV